MVVAVKAANDNLVSIQDAQQEQAFKCQLTLCDLTINR